MVLGDRIKKRRLELNMTQEELGDLIGVSKVAICTYENNTRTPKLDTLKKISEALSIEFTYLLGFITLLITASFFEFNYSQNILLSDKLLPLPLMIPIALVNNVTIPTSIAKTAIQKNPVGLRLALTTS